MLPPEREEQVEEPIQNATSRSDENRERIQHEIVVPPNTLIDHFASYKNQHKTAEERKRRREITTIWGIFITAGIAFITAGIFACQLREMEKVYGPIRDQAAATRDAIAISQRPIVYFSQSAFFTNVNEKNERFWGVTLGIGNSGNLPTKDFSYKLGCVPSQSILIDPFSDQTFREQKSAKANLGPKILIQPVACRYNSDKMEVIAKGILYVIGETSYRDRFDNAKIRQTEYCFRIAPILFQPKEGNISGESIPCESGHNCADEECEKKE
jgi:hypothetical protein